MMIKGILQVIFAIYLVNTGFIHGKPAGGCDHPADIAFVLDSSSSIYPGDFVKQLQFVKNLVDGFNIGLGSTQTRVGVLTFGERARLKFALNQHGNKKSLQDAIENISYRPEYRTMTDTAINFLTEHMFTNQYGSRPDVDHIAIIITDGKSTESEKTKKAAKAAHAAGMQVYAIGVGPNYSLEELKEIASDKQFVYEVDNYNALQSVTDDLAIRTCEVTTTTTTTTEAPPTTQRTTTTTSIPTTTERPQQDVDKFECNGKPMDLYFLMDSSGSIGWKNYKIQKEFVKDLINDFSTNQTDTRVGLIIFSEQYKLSIPLGSIGDKAQLLSSIDNLPYLRQGTNTGAAIKFVREEAFSNGLSRPEAQKVLILLTDGLSRDPADTRVQATLARESGITIFAIGIGKGADQDELEDIANKPETKYVVFVEEFEDLKSNDIKDVIATRTCIKTPQTTSPTSTVAPSTTTLRTTTTTTPKVTTTERIQQDKDEDACNDKPMDLYFLMDSSGSIGWTNYKIQKEFVKDLINDFSVNQTDTRVGLIIFSENYKLSIPLGSIGDKAQLLSSIDNLPYLRQGTNTGAAIKFVREEAFSNGLSRPEAQKVLILLTDGLSRDTSDTRKQATQARESGITIFAIGIGKGADKNELRDIANKPEKKYVLFVKEFEDLKSAEIKDTIATRTCIRRPTEQPTTSTTTTAAPSTSKPTTQTTVTTTIPKATTTERIQQDTEACSGKPMDLYFLMDSSGSIGWKNYKIQKEFVKDLISDFKMNQTDTRVGLIIFSEKYNLSIPLGSIGNKAQILSSIDNLPYLRRGTNTGAAVKFVREEAFSNGLSRPEAQKVLILLTDGLSRDPADTRLQATLARESGITIFAIGIGEGADKDELKDIANKPETKYVLFVDDFEDLRSNDIKDAIATRTCIRRPNDQPTCRPSGLLDVVFVYDAFSLGSRISMEITNFIASIIQNMDMTSGIIRVGRIVTDCPENANLALSSQRLPSIINIRFPGMRNLVNNLRTTAFSQANGGRAGAKRAAIIFLNTDDANIKDTLSEIATLNNTHASVVLVGQQQNLGSVYIGDHSVYNLNSYQQLPEFKVAFLRKFCTRIAQPEGVRR